MRLFSTELYQKHVVIAMVALLTVVTLEPARAANSGVPTATSSDKVDAEPDIDPVLCHRLIKHTPSANVEYQAGVDADGNAVAPADLPGPAEMRMPQTVNIPLNLQLSKILNLNTSTYPLNTVSRNADAEIGVLKVTGDEVLFNGQPLSDTQQDQLAVLCMKQTSAGNH